MTQFVQSIRLNSSATPRFFASSPLNGRRDAIFGIGMSTLCLSSGGNYKKIVPLSSPLSTYKPPDESKAYLKSPNALEEHTAGETGINEPVQEHGVTEQKRAAKIHDFCFGIPYGGLVLGGGLLGLIFSRNLATLRTVMIGGALLSLSTFSLKIWRQGKSSLPFVLGQAVLSAVLFWKNYEAYTLTKTLIPTGFYAAISAAMVCFYSYVVISGGNPPPKKLKSSAVTPS